VARDPGPICFLIEYIKLNQCIPLQLLRAKRTCSSPFERWIKEDADYGFD
jgi:hypothetical protein